MSVVGVKCCWNRVEMLGVIRKKLYRDVKGTRHGRKRMKGWNLFKAEEEHEQKSWKNQRTGLKFVMTSFH